MEMRKWVESLMALGPGWEAKGVEEDPVLREARVRVARRTGEPLTCPECGQPCPGYDAREREWRHWTLGARVRPMSLRPRTQFGCTVPGCLCIKQDDE